MHFFDFVLKRFQLIEIFEKKTWKNSKHFFVIFVENSVEILERMNARLWWSQWMITMIIFFHFALIRLERVQLMKFWYLGNLLQNELPGIWIMPIYLPFSSISIYLVLKVESVESKVYLFTQLQYLRCTIYILGV